MSGAVKNTTLNTVQREAVLTLCAKHRPVFSLSMSELGRCTTAVATFPLPDDTRVVDKAPYRSHPSTSGVVDKCVNGPPERGIIEKRPSPWGNPVTIVGEENSSPRFCVEYRHPLNRAIVRKSWPLPHLETCLDSVGFAAIIRSPTCTALSGNYRWTKIK